MNHAELEKLLTELSEPAFRARQLFSWLHEKQIDDFEAMTSIPAKLRERLAKEFYIGLPVPIRRQLSKKDGTEKFLLKLSDGECVEAVWMEYRHGNTVCISTQVGCRMGCSFCASTLGGLQRNLLPGEMLGELYAIAKAKGKRIGGVVLMGIGEPLDNFDNVLRFLTLLSDKGGMNLSPRHVSLSTCGVVPNIDRLAAENIPLTLSISLHAPDDAKRTALMPVNKRYPVGELLAACSRYFAATGRRISFEYALIAGKNDTQRDAESLARLLATQHCHVNLIPVNEVKGREAKRGTRESAERFQRILQKGGVTATIRRELGADIEAACGQLRHQTSKEEEQC